MYDESALHQHLIVVGGGGRLGWGILLAETKGKDVGKNFLLKDCTRDDPNALSRVNVDTVGYCATQICLWGAGVGQLAAPGFSFSHSQVWFCSHNLVFHCGNLGVSIIF